MSLIIDTSVIIAVITNESHKERCIELTQGEILIALHSLHWEIGNAFSAMFRRKRLNIKEALAALKYYQEIPIEFCDVNLKTSLEIAHKFNMYAYDAYFIACALQLNMPLFSLDQNLTIKAKEAGALLKEVIL